jgi:hypothetical protein
VGKLAQQTGVSYGGTHRVMKYLHLQPYKLTPVNELKEWDIKRFEYFLYFRDVITGDEQDILYVTIFFTDAARFASCGYVNSQNRPVWSTTNLQD